MTEQNRDATEASEANPKLFAGLTCIHAAQGLCPECQEAYDYDPAAWHEFGDHPAGIAAWHALQEELARSPSIVGPPLGDEFDPPEIPW